MNTIIENAKSSIQMGVQDFKAVASGDEKRVLSAVRNIYAGILLLFKSRLVEESPTYDKELLIRENIIFVKDSSGNIIPKGVGKRTVDYRSIEKRFKDLEVDVDWKTMENIQKVRNDIEHYCTTLSKENIMKTISDTFLILDSFITKHLEKHPKEFLGEETWAFILSQTETYKQLKAVWLEKSQQLNFNNRKVKDNIDHIYCPNCNFDIFSIFEGYKDDKDPTLVCTACNTEVKYKEYVQTIIEHLTPIRSKDDIDSDDSFCQCPSCSENTYLYSEDICFSCDGENLSTCSYCEEKIEGYMMNGNLYNLCDNCNHMKYLADKND